MIEKIRTGNPVITSVHPNVEKILEKMEELENIQPENPTLVFMGDNLIVDIEKSEVK